MPVMDGYTACTILKRNEKRGMITKSKIVAISADTTIQNKNKCAAVGFDDFLGKPVMLEKMNELLQSLDVNS